MGHALRRPAPSVPSGRDLSLTSSRRTDWRPPAADRTIAERIRAEFAEMRGFSPTPGQAARLFGLSREDCDRVLSMLAREGFLHLDPDGRYRTG